MNIPGFQKSVQTIFSESWVLWASNDKVGQVAENFGRHFKSTTPVGSQLIQVAGFVILAVGIVGVVCFLSRFFNIFGEKSAGDDSRSVYRKLCAAHHLTLRERLLIRKIVKRLDLENPLVLFVEPQYFQSVFTQPDFEINRTMINTVFKKFFGYPAEPEPCTPTEKQPEKHTEKLSSASSSEPVSGPNVFQRIKTFMLVPDHILSNAVEKTTEAPAADEMTVPVHQEHEATVPMPSFSRKIILPPAIPGSQAFSSIAATFTEIKSEIASKSIHHILTKGRENERTFKIYEESSHDLPEQDSLEIELPLPAPKPLSSTLNELQQQEKIEIEQRSKQAPTKPRLVPLRPHWRKPIEPPVKVLPVTPHERRPHVKTNIVTNGGVSPDETFQMGDVVMIESLVTKKL